MNTILEVAGLVTIAAVTPGPNNFIVLRAAARGGVRGALPALAGVMLGGLTVLGVALVASQAVFAAVPEARSALGIAGCAYLVWLGVWLFRKAGSVAAETTTTTTTTTATTTKSSVLGVFGFQFLNPKSWVMVMTAIGAMPGGDLASACWLFAVFAMIPTVCLFIWAGVGAALARCLARPRVAIWVDRTMGAVLVATAIALVSP